MRTASTVNKGVSNQSDLLVAKKNPTPLNCSGLKECVCGFDMLDDYTETILVYLVLSCAKKWSFICFYSIDLL